MKLEKILHLINITPFLFLFSSYISPVISSQPFNKPMYFVTVSDKEHYPWLEILLNSIYEHNQNKNIQILVYDIGLLEDQIRSIESNYNVKVYQIEETNPSLKSKFVVRPNGRLARGWYAWKPVAMKQALEYFPYFIYIDAGKRLTGPSDDIFNIIIEQGYFLMHCGHEIEPMTTQRVRKYFNLDTNENNWILDKFGIEAGIQGLSNKVYENYIKPIYDLTYDISWFEDDGTAPWGFGGCRHDQSIFSIVARLQKFYICGDLKESCFFVNGKKIPFVRGDYFQFKEFTDNPLAKEYNLI